ncbi:sacsin isoform X1, partial [Tanacetum coccineum]
RQAVEEFERGRVSDEEFNKAVQDMFSGSGINTDMENKCLLQKTLSLQERVNESQAALVFEQKKIETATKDADTAKAALQCRICKTSEIDIALIPCGHVLCRSCSSHAASCCSILNQRSGKTQGIIYLPLMQVCLNPRKTTENVEKRINSFVSSPSSGNLKAGWSVVKAKGKGLGRKIAQTEGAEDTRIRHIVLMVGKVIVGEVMGDK